MKRTAIIVVGLIVILSTLLAFIGCKTSPPDEQESQRIARDFLINSATFKFDGIKDSLELTATDTLKSPYSWEFIYQFECSHSGYGDRSGQNLLQVIMPHTARIRVMQGQVAEAIVDNKWDEIEQVFLETPPSPVPAAPNDSIVTAKVLNVIHLEGDVPWEMAIVIQASEDVPGLNNATKSRVGETITIRTSEDVSEVEKGQVITARVQLVGDERSRFYMARDIK